MNIRIQEAVAAVYGPGDARVAKALAGIGELIDRYQSSIPSGRQGLDASDCLLICYGDSIQKAGEQPLTTLHRFLGQYIGSAISYVHLLPFCPFTSDDGFSVVDYRRINPELGDWPQVEAIAADFRLCADLVLNHVSQDSDYVRGHLGFHPDYADFCISEDPDDPLLKQVVRPRTTPLLHPFITVDGRTVPLWTTFSQDQVDLNYANPAVLVEMLDVLLAYARHGAAMIRLDAIAFLWKELGTDCLHRPQAHAIIQVVRAVYDLLAPHVLLLSETNVPHQENISYFGKPPGSEAQLVYNFTLAPMILHALSTGDAVPFTSWAQGVAAPGSGCCFLNMTATHDGIGMRPTEGILPEVERQRLCQLVSDHGGTVSYKDNGDGTQTPYELNINWYDALNDPAGDLSEAQQVARLLASQALVLGFMGMPSLYVHTLFGSRSWREGWQQSGIPRRINRQPLDAASLAAELADPAHRRHDVFQGLLRLLRLRAVLPAFHPEAPQQVHAWDAGCVVLERGTGRQAVLVVVNVSGETRHLCLPMPWRDADDLLHGPDPVDQLPPWGVRWLQRREVHGRN